MSGPVNKGLVSNTRDLVGAWIFLTRRKHVIRELIDAVVAPCVLCEVLCPDVAHP